MSHVAVVCDRESNSTGLWEFVNLTAVIASCSSDSDSSSSSSTSSYSSSASSSYDGARNRNRKYNAQNGYFGQYAQSNRKRLSARQSVPAQQQPQQTTPEQAVEWSKILTALRYYLSANIASANTKQSRNIVNLLENRDVIKQLTTLAQQNSGAGLSGFTPGIVQPAGYPLMQQLAVSVPLSGQMFGNIRGTAPVQQMGTLGTQLQQMGTPVSAAAPLTNRQVLVHNSGVTPVSAGIVEYATMGTNTGAIQNPASTYVVACPPQGYPSAWSVVQSTAALQTMIPTNSIRHLGEEAKNAAHAMFINSATTQELIARAQLQGYIQGAN
eukprot:Gregarina_sp_Poly_1__4907@NODE_2602_length_1932_cov_279_756568_g1649_i0_p1_GENE_NODE_2602_length_1932_cov_279_756568_g1649_i0NODE_2602_length_1932_cov_279_756568_g1649_i0_p1_ORF_typecomplete_len326_score37_94SR25/PF10500_9/0_0017Toprim_C_rpt/PF13368_6/0_12_NODE_2602_length_1932_cov_279_756568_g1649_i01721149